MSNILGTLGGSGYAVNEIAAATSASPLKQMLPQLASAIAAYKRGFRTRPPVIMGIFDSNGVPDGAGDGGTHFVNAFGKGPFTQIATLQPTLAGLPLKNTAWLGEGNMSTSAFAVGVTTFNPNLILGSGWNRDPAQTFGLGGFWMRADASAAGYLEYRFGGPISHCEFLTRTSATDSSSIGVYNSSNTLITSFTSVAGAPGIQKITVANSFSDGIVKVKNNAASFFRLGGMIAWNDAVPSIILVNSGFCGSKVADYNVTTSPWDGMGFYPLIAPDATLVSLTINDILAPTARATYNTSLTTMLSTCSEYGSLIVSTGGNGSAAGYSDGTSRGIEAEAKAVASKFSAPFISMHDEWVSWAATNAIGYELDANHRRAVGYLDQARVYGEAFKAFLGS